MFTYTLENYLTVKSRKGTEYKRGWENGKYKICVIAAEGVPEAIEHKIVLCDLHIIAERFPDGSIKMVQDGDCLDAGYINAIKMFLMDEGIKVEDKICKKYLSTLKANEYIDYCKLYTA